MDKSLDDDKKTPKQNVNEGHRARLRKRLTVMDQSKWDAADALEFLLFAANARMDTNKIARSLLNQFGTLKNVFSASISSLCEVEGVSLATAETLTVIGRVMDYMEWSRDYDIRRIFSFKQTAKLALNAVSDITADDMVIVGINNRYEILFEKELNCAIPIKNITLREIAHYCIEFGATGLLVAQVHIGGNVQPTYKDNVMTQDLLYNMFNIGVVLFDHIIVSGTEVYSFQRNGKLDACRRKLGIDYQMVESGMFQNAPITYHDDEDDL